ncbi:hypothetical protein Tco_0330910 [Tanacetum coccineum]
MEKLVLALNDPHVADGSKAGPLLVKSRRDGEYYALQIQVPGSENKKADALSKIALTSFAHLSKQVLVEELKEKSINTAEGVITVEKRKGIDLLSEVALTEEAQYEEVRKKSLRDFHKTHPSGSGIVTKISPSVAKVKPSVTNKGTDEDDNNNVHDSKSECSDQESDSGDDITQSIKQKGSDSEHETDENETGSKSDQEENKEEVKDDEEEKDYEFVKTPSNDTDDEDVTKIKDKAEGDEDEGMDYTTNQFDDDVDLRMNEPVNTDEGFIQNEGTDAEMIKAQQGNENPEITFNEVIEDAHVTLSIVTKKTEIPVTSSSFRHSI